METLELTKKEGIKESAKALFFRFGFGKTSMEDIARESGLAKPTLYYYYPNKEAIFNEVVVDEAEAFIRHAEEQLPPGMAADEKIAAFLRNVYQDMKIYAIEISGLPAALCEQYPHGRPVVEKINSILKDRLHPLLSEGYEKGIFDLRDEKVTLQALSFMIDFLNLDWMRRIPEHTRDKAVDTVIDIVLNGLKRR